MSYLEFFSALGPLVGEKEVRDPLLTVFGVPYDSTTSFRPGTRFGPNAIREAFLNVEAYSKVFNVDVEKLPIRDVGNVAKVNEPSEMVEIVSKVTKELFAAGERFCMLGGEHSLTFGSFSNAPKRTGLVVFDAHFDLRDDWEGSKLSHACYLRRLTETRSPSTVAHIGGRAATKEEWKQSEGLGLVIPPGREGDPKSIQEFKKFCDGFDSLYFTVDIDGLDPAFAPGTGTPEAGGLTSRELLAYIYAAKGSKLASFDIMEVSPHYDNGVTAAVAARIMNELVALMASSAK